MKLNYFTNSIVFTMLILMSSVTFAEKPVLDVVVAHGNGGNAWAEGNMLRDALVNEGYDSEVVWTKNCQNTLIYENKDTGRPAVRIRSATSVVNDPKKGCDIPVEGNFVTPWYNRLQVMCVSADESANSLTEFLSGKDEVTIATTNTFPKGVYDGVIEETGVEFSRVDYDGSSRVLAGLVSGDTDMMYTGYTKREATNDQIKCYATSSNTSVDDMDTFENLFPEWKYNTLGSFKYIHSINLPEERRDEVVSVINRILDENDKVNSYITNANMVLGTEISNGNEVLKNDVNTLNSN